MLSQLVDYIVERIVELDWMAVALGVLIETIIVPIPSPLIPMAAGFALLSRAEGIGFIATLFIKIGLVGAATATLANLPFYYIGLKGGEPVMRRMSRWIGVDEEEIEKAVKLIGGGRPTHLIIYRALPIMPLSLVSLATGALRRSTREFTLYTFTGCLPRYVFLGYLGWVMQDLYMEMADLLDSLETATIVLIILAAGTYILVKRLLRR